MPNPTRHIFCRGRCLAVLLLVLVGWLAAPACAAPVAGAPAPGAARIYVYRNYEPFQSLATPYVRLNGAVVGVSRPGGALYRDVAPGRYRVTVDSDGSDVHQFVTIDVVAGDIAYIRIESLDGWDSGGGGNRGAGWARDTFYTRLVPTMLAEREMTGMPLYSGS